jgi:dTDP-4-dehydrorhamnose reductase
MTGQTSVPRHIWVTGAEGFVGSYINARLVAQGQQVTGTALVATPSLKQLDVSKSEQVARVLKNLTSEDVVIHAAACAHVDWCEEHPRESSLINRQGTEYIADRVAQAGARLVYFSSEYVFDGAAGPYAEDDTPAPLNVYGQQKLMAEQYVATRVPNHVIVRTTTVFGYEVAQKNFLMSLLGRLQADNNEVLVPHDQVSTPTYVVDVATITADVAGRDDIQGLLHVAGGERMNRLELARRITQVFGGSLASLKGVSTATLHQSAQRPLSAGLRIDRLRSLQYTVTDLEKALNLIKNAHGYDLRADQGIGGPVLPGKIWSATV